jgi:DNA polymerase III sliding clamp (beta) subunit (PCNA family)|tara:strand:- start:6535 stop:7662 length:1128 start_codon:yes stop_codon:yes gene_type:complete
MAEIELEANPNCPGPPTKKDLKVTDTSVLKAALDIVRPGLSSVNVIPIFSHFCFDGHTVTAYNDVIGIQTKYAGDIKGALHGPTLLGILNNTKAKEIEVANEDGGAKLKLGRAKATLAMLPTEDFVFELPGLDVEKDHSFFANDKIISAIKDCLVAMGTDYSRPTMMGITMRVKEKRGVLYATTGHSLARASLPKSATKHMDDCDVILPADFCTNLVKLAAAEKGKDITILFNDFEVMATTGRTSLFSRLISTETPLDFEGVFRSSTKEFTTDHIPIPKNLIPALKRSLIIVGDASTNIQAKIEKGKAILQTTGVDNRLRDVIAIDKKHPDVTANIAADVLLKIIEGDDSILFGKHCVSITRSTSLRYLIINKVD